MKKVSLSEYFSAYALDLVAAPVRLYTQAYKEWRDDGHGPVDAAVMSALAGTGWNLVMLGVGATGAILPTLVVSAINPLAGGITAVAATAFMGARAAAVMSTGEELPRTARLAKLDKEAMATASAGRDEGRADQLTKRDLAPR